ncbi:hypothetical protein [Salinarchaeum chitinilyticum]
MSADGATEAETVLADLELSRSLAIQWAVVGTMGVGVALGAFSGLYQAATGQTPSYLIAPSGVGWWVEPLSVLAILALASVIIVPHEWLHGLAIATTAANRGTASASHTSSCPMPTRRRTTAFRGTSSSSCA